jgi:hypothetical protein
MHFPPAKGLTFAVIMLVGSGCSQSVARLQATDGSTTSPGATATTNEPPCSPGDLQFVLDRQEPLSEGFHAWLFYFGNQGNSECALSGYPEVAATDSAGRDLELVQSDRSSSDWWNSESTGEIDLTPGDKASFLAVYGADPGKACDADYDWVSVMATLPEQSQKQLTAEASGSPHLSFAPCLGTTLTVSPLQPGATLPLLPGEPSDEPTFRSPVTPGAPLPSVTTTPTKPRQRATS